ncbi:uncharacterized protein MKZ38_007251 [Zalerion maritima]|uniref:RNA recognition motif-containing protein n=1 Tax=Zalerion maritima TaxID=339359 RepID=A0AAD5RI82_9PEZI|nr:uncharacterized protein MKZ38_007251 [Zalerion maritima]
MAVRPGEENVATLFGDIHYFYSDPAASPPHHRFDKGSYVYLFENANERRARIEIANQPGTDNQDAFDGFLDSTRINYSYKHSCMVNIAIGRVQGVEEWHLPTYDPRNENKYHYKLQSLDMYFWAQRDALQFVNAVRRVLPPHQVDVQDEPPPPPHHSSDMSPVVQKLEKAAIAGPPPGAPPATQAPATTSAGGHPVFAPPPISAVAVTGEEAQASYAPMAYNPAAPAAPESVKPREKTPPPDDDGVNPLHQALVQDTVMSPSFAPHVYGLHPGSLPGPPSQPPPGVSSPGFPPQGLQSPGFAPAGYGTQAPVHPGLARAATMPGQGALPSPGLSSPYGNNFPGSPGIPPPPAQPQPTHATPPAVTSPGLPPPPGGFAQYSYANARSTPSGSEYAVHQQAYKPTQEELMNSEIAGNGPQTTTMKNRKLEENAGRLERGVTGMLKKFEKKFG